VIGNRYREPEQVKAGTGKHRGMDFGGPLKPQEPKRNGGGYFVNKTGMLKSIR